MSALPGPLSPELAGALERLDDLVRMFEEHPDATVQDAVFEMLRAIDVVHRGALHWLAAFLDARALLDDALAEPHVALLFGLYDPRDEEPRSLVPPEHADVVFTPRMPDASPVVIPVSALTRRSDNRSERR